MQREARAARFAVRFAVRLLFKNSEEARRVRSVFRPDSLGKRLHYEATALVGGRLAKRNETCGGASIGRAKQARRGGAHRYRVK